AECFHRPRAGRPCLSPRDGPRGDVRSLRQSAAGRFHPSLVSRLLTMYAPPFLTVNSASERFEDRTPTRAACRINVVGERGGGASLPAACVLNVVEGPGGGASLPAACLLNVVEGPGGGASLHATWLINVVGGPGGGAAPLSPRT